MKLFAEEERHGHGHTFTHHHRPPIQEAEDLLARRVDQADVEATVFHILLHMIPEGRRFENHVVNELGHQAGLERHLRDHTCAYSPACLVLTPEACDVLLAMRSGNADLESAGTRPCNHGVHPELWGGGISLESSRSLVSDLLVAPLG